MPERQERGARPIRFKRAVIHTLKEILELILNNQTQNNLLSHPIKSMLQKLATQT